jgi:protein-S-isoprenylcysteine O-methyltransferase Ste14
MDPINIIIGINIVALFGANVGGAKKGLKSSISQVKERSKTFLQQVPPWLATFVLLISIIWLFPIGAIAYLPEYDKFRIPALVIYVICSWLQVLSYKQLGDNYSQEIVVFRYHKLVQSGLYRVVRHPQYALQIITDIALTVALINYVAVPFVIAEIPLFIMRASFEDKLMQRTFPDEFEKYKSKSGFMLPFIG